MRVNEMDIRRKFTEIVGTYLIKGYCFTADMTSDGYRGLSCSVKLAKDDATVWIAIVAPKDFEKGVVKVVAQVHNNPVEEHRYYVVRPALYSYTTHKHIPAVIFDEEEFEVINAKREARARLKKELEEMEIKFYTDEKYLEIARRFLARKLDEYNEKERHRNHWFSAPKYYLFKDVKSIVFSRESEKHRQYYRISYKFKRCKTVDDVTINHASTFWAHHTYY